MQDKVQKNLERILKGDIKYTSSILGLNLLLARMQNKYQSDPSPTTLRNIFIEINDYISRYEKLLAGELKNIENL